MDPKVLSARLKVYYKDVKKVVKDLEDYDLLKVIESFQKERIKNLDTETSFFLDHV